VSANYTSVFTSTDLLITQIQLAGLLV